MALHLPPAISISKFTGGYKSLADYTDLADTETNDAQNTLYSPSGDIEQRLGSRRILPVKLANVATPTVGEPITGHFYFDKNNPNASPFNVVAAGDSLYSYSSATAVAIATSLNDNSTTFWTFCQVQDPRSAGDDLILAANGVNAIKVWNGSGTAVNLTSFTSATQVPVCKYLLTHKERIYAFNILDNADVDSGVKVMRTGFGTDGAADPHRFTETFYIGGSSKGGDLKGGRVLNDQLFFFTRKSTWRFSPSSGGISDLQQLGDNIGVLAPFSIVDAGGFLIFLSDRGVYAFDGVNFKHLSEDIDDQLFQDSNAAMLQYAKAEFVSSLNQYILYYAGTGSSQNNRGLIYDLREGMQCWQPPITGRRVSFVSNFDNADGRPTIIYGDYNGYLYEDGVGTNDGREIAYNGTVTTGGYGAITDSTAMFYTTGDGLAGLIVRVIDGTGEGQERIIASNTSNTFTPESNWTVPLDTTSQYTIGGIDAYWRSRDYEFGNHDLVKLFRHLRIRAKEEGNFNLTVHYIVDFRELSQATKKDVKLLESGTPWDGFTWDSYRWGARSTIRKKISLRNTSTQPTNGTHLALRYSNRRANETFKISGFDIELKDIGKR